MTATYESMKIKLSRLVMPMYSGSYNPTRLLPGTEQWRNLFFYYCLVGGLAVWVVHLLGNRLPLFFSAVDTGHLVEEYIRNTSHRLRLIKTWDGEAGTRLPSNSSEHQEAIPDLINPEGEISFQLSNRTRPARVSRHYPNSMKPIPLTAETMGSTVTEKNNTGDNINATMVDIQGQAGGIRNTRDTKRLVRQIKDKSKSKLRPS